MVDSVSRAIKEGENMLDQTKVGMQTTLAEFKELRQFLEKEERLFVAQLQEANEIRKKQEAYAAKLDKTISLCDSFMQEMGEKCQQPAAEFLQDFESTLKRCEEKKREKFEKPVVFCPTLRQKIIETTAHIHVMKNVMEQFRSN